MSLPLEQVEQPPVPHQARQSLVCAIALAEAALCFAAVTIALVLGTVFWPLFVWAMLSEGHLDWLEPVSMVTAGWCGVAALIRVLYLLCHDTPPDGWRPFTIAGLAIGSAALLYRAFLANAPGGFVPLMIISGMPLLCTAHVCFLVRRSWFR